MYIISNLTKSFLTGVDDAKFAFERRRYHHAYVDYSSSRQLLQVQTSTSRIFEYYQSKSSSWEAFTLFCLLIKGIGGLKNLSSI